MRVTSLKASALMLALAGLGCWDTTAQEGFTLENIGSPAIPGSVALVAGGFDLSAAGRDISGTSDQFSFSWTQRTGDFDVNARLEGLSFTDSWAKAGLMARESLATNSRFAAIFATPNVSGSFFTARNTNGGVALSSGSFPINYPNTWLRLKRAGNTFTGYASFDGQNWNQLGSATLSMPAVAYFGAAVTSRKTNSATVARFRELQDTVGGAVVSYTFDVEPPGPSSRRTPFAITEIMYNPAPNPQSNRLEFVEVYNSNPFFEDIGGYRLSGDLDFAFPAGTVMQAGSYAVVARDPAAVKAAYNLPDFNGTVGVLGGYTNSLKGSGTIRLRNMENAILLEIPYASQPPWPAGADGAGHSLVLARPSYGEGYAQAWALSDKVGGSPGRYDGPSSSPQRSVVINEFFANSEAPDQDYVELYNHSNQDVDLSGCTLSDDPHTNKFVLPNDAIIPARGFLVYHQAQLGFGLSSGGETIYLRSQDGTRVLDAIRYEAQAAGISSGRSPEGAKEIYPLKTHTPGAANADILVHDIVINEIMYRPISTEEDDEYVELYNQGTNTVSLAGWRFNSGIDYTFPVTAALGPGAYLVVARNASRLLTNYPNLNANNTYGNYDGSLRNRGERLALARPDTSISTNSQGIVRTNTVYVVVDEVSYLNGGSWGTWANEGGSSLELIDPRSNHRLAQNWTDSDETQKAPWTTVTATGQMDNGSDTPNWVEILALGEGELLVDDYEVRTGIAGTNYLTAANSSFSSGLGGWRLRGTHIRSSVDSEGGVGGSQCLHLRTSARGDTMGNRALCSIPALPTSGTVTLQAKVRWLRGWPEVLLRVRGNWMEAYGRLALPSNLGTPGLRNSRAATNAPPAISEVAHAPVIPAANEAVVVTARVHDPDGAAAVQLNYRPDPSTNYTAVIMRDDGTSGDAVAGDGVYSGSIPAPGSPALYAFQVTASDTLGARQVFPLQLSGYRHPFECLVRFGDPVITSGFATYRQWMTQSNINDFVNRPPLSNEKIFETFVYGNFRAIYNTSMKWSASPYHQWGNPAGGTSSNPNNTDAHYVIETPLDDLFLGTENINKIHSPGNSPFDDVTIQREQISYWTARQLRLPWNYRRFVNMFFNGNRRGGTTRLMEDTTRAGDDFVDAYFADDPDGHLYKLQPWFEQDDPGSGANNRAWCALNRFTTLSNGVPVPKTARYRQTYLVRAAGSTANDFAPVYSLIDAANATNSFAVQAASLSALADMEEWFRIFALVHSVGDWDHFGYRNSQNMYAYKPERGLWTLMIWDFNIVLGNSGSDAANTLTLAQNLTSVNGQDQIMPTLYRNPPFRRMYLRALKEICNAVWVTNKYAPILDAKYQAFLASGVTPSNPDAIKTFIALARTTILNSIRTEDATNFVMTSAGAIDTTNNFVVLTGQAPVEAKTILVNGREYFVTWTNARSFVIYVPVAAPTTVLALQGYGLNGQALPGFSASVTVNFSGQVPPPEDSLVINEIMYNPANPDASFLEIYNNSDFAYDLSGWRVNGIDFTFPAGAVITNRQFLVLAKDRAAFAAAYGSGVLVFGEFDGDFDNGGETLTLERPSSVLSTNGNSVVVTNTLYLPVNKVKYDDDPPWITTPDGFGPSLQLTDASQDNSRVSNWTDGAGWRFFTFTGPFITTSTNPPRLLLFLNTTGDLYIDELSFVEGTVPGVGQNLALNGDFEGPLFATEGGPWGATAGFESSHIAADIKYAGNSSVHIVQSGAGGGTVNMYQDIAAVPGATYTLSFWYLPNTNAATNLTVRMTPGSSFRPVAEVRAIQSTPGSANTAAKSLPPYDPLWLNEVQPINLAGVRDGQGEAEPWLELYNAGTNAVALDGYFLANNYSNLTQWPFPAGAALAPGQFKMVWADGEANESTAGDWHTSFRLGGSTGSVALVRMVQNAPQITDYLNYPGLAPALSYGSYPDGQPFNRQVLYAATPGSNNVVRTGAVFINEWLAGNTRTLADPANASPAYDDWFELFNPGPTDVDLSGAYLTDNLNNKTKFRIPSGYTLPAGAYLLVWADEEHDTQNLPGSPDLHVNFRLALGGEAIGLYSSTGVTLDEVIFGQQTNEVSQGRWPDGAGALYFMTTPTPRAPNTLGPVSTPRITAVNVVGGQFSLTFQTVAGRTYRVLFAENLDDNPVNWMPLGADQTATGTSLNVTDQINSHPQRFFRVVQLD